MATVTKLPDTKPFKLVGSRSFSPQAKKKKKILKWKFGTCRFYSVKTCLFATISCQNSCSRHSYGGPGGHTMRRYLSADGDVTVDDDDVTVDDGDVTVDDDDVMVDFHT